MFERFTDRARRVLVVAQNEARTLNHPFIEPEHLLLGLAQGDGIAAVALGQLGVKPHGVRVKVAEAITPATTDGGASKVPFSRKSKTALEMSLREALGLGHNYIGTEHLLLGVLRVADGDSCIIEVLGVGADEVRARVLEVLPTGARPESQRSPALAEAMQRARGLAGTGPVTTGQVLLAMLADGDSQASKALQPLGVNTDSLEAQLAQVPISGTSDSPPPPRAVGIKLGQVTTTIDDPDLAAALGDLTPEELAAALRRALGTNPDVPPSDPEI